jgi:predicted phage baseplate assembly protein
VALQDQVPVIDDRRFADILAEVRARIARYTPEWKPVWNDYNDSDPGITLAQLFAWLSEMLLYRMAKVPTLNYLKFLELLGIELEPAQPAAVAVSFPVKEDAAVPFVTVPKATQVSAPADDGGLPVIFETEASITALAAQLLSVQAFDGVVYTDWTACNAAATAYAPFGPIPAAGAALVLGFGYPQAYTGPNSFPAVQFDLSVFAASDVAGPPTLSCGVPQTGIYAPARLQWECWTGSAWQRIDTLRDDSFALTRTGVITVRTPAGVMTSDSMGAYHSDATHPKLFWIRGRLIQAQYEMPPSVLTVRTNTVATLQAQTVAGEVLGGTDGSRNQSWTLTNSPVIRGSVQVQIDEGTGAADWSVKDDLLSSDKDSLDLALDPTSGTLTAGDGVHGAVPAANAQNPDANVVAVSYRYGGGARGNVAAGAINALLTAVDDIDTGKVTNLFAAAGGADQERLDAATTRAQKLVRSQGRAVTAADFESLATQVGQVARAKALPLFHPQFPQIPVPGVVSVIIVPIAQPVEGVPFKPLPSDGLLRTVCAYLNARRLLTTELYVIAPSYQQIAVSVTVVPAAEADGAAVWNGVQQAITAYFDPLSGGDAKQGWGFGDTVRYSKVYQRIFEVEGVDAIEGLIITLDGNAFPACQDVVINANGLLFSGDHQVLVTLPAAETTA